MHRRPARWLWLGVFLCLSGCGSSVGKATGRITLGGKPVAGAEIVFTSAANENQEFFGLAGDDGNYQVSYRELRGLPVGHYRVTVSRYTLPNGKPLPEGEAGEVLKSDGRAAKQTYVFEKDIGAGSNTVDFELNEGKKVSKPAAATGAST